MFYKQFLEITDVLNSNFVEEFDFWLATLPPNDQKNITASVVASRLNVKYVLAQAILEYAAQKKILEKYYIIKCPDCDFFIETVKPDELADVLVHPVLYCEDCEEEKHITTEDIYIAYRVILNAPISERELSRVIEKRLNATKNSTINFHDADSLVNNLSDLYSVFYCPDESAYKHFEELQAKLDGPFKNTTEQGTALEKLILEIFASIKYVHATNDVKTQTNQFDVTALCDISTPFPSVLNYLSPYFIIECKNERRPPNNTYTNKLESIIDVNEAQIGIVFGRLDATAPCFQISRDHYLTNKNLPKQKIIITCSDSDLNYIINRRVNLLQYLEYKIFQVTAGSPTLKFESFQRDNQH